MINTSIRARLERLAGRDPALAGERPAAKSCRRAFRTDWASAPAHRSPVRKLLFVTIAVLLLRVSSHPVFAFQQQPAPQGKDDPSAFTDRVAAQLLDQVREGLQSRIVKKTLGAFDLSRMSGGPAFKNQMLEKMEGELGEHHSGELRRESAEAKAQRIVAEELERRGWQEADLAARAKGDPGKLEIAARLRRETTLSLKGIAERAKLGTSRSANMRLHKWMKRAVPPAAAERARP